MRGGRRYARRLACASRFHPLNQLRQSWLFGLPQFTDPLATGGDPIVSITGKYDGIREGVFTNFITPFGTSIGWSMPNQSNHAYVPNTLAVPQRVTIAAWFVVSTNRDYIIIHKGDGATFPGTSFFAAREPATTNTLRFYVSSGSGWTIANSGASFTDNRWHRFVGTYDGAAVRIYVDGILLNSQSVSLTIPSSSADWDWGVHPAYGAVGPPNGMADLSISARAWTPSDVSIDYMAGRNGYTDDRWPVIEWTDRDFSEDYGGTDPPLMEFSTGLGVGTSYQNLSTQNFETRLYASGTASGLGELTPDGPLDFTTEVQLSQFAMVAPPVLMPFQTGVDVDYSQSITSPMQFTTGVGVSHDFHSIINGNRRIIGGNRYKR